MTDKFFILRIFLFGESPRLIVPKAGKADVEGRGGSIAFNPFGIAVIDLDRGAMEFGDSGDELGEGSVRAVSMVEMVVVGDDSTESKVAVESFLNNGEDK